MTSLGGPAQVRLVSSKVKRFAKKLPRMIKSSKMEEIEKHSEDEEDFYKNASTYWGNVSATDQGMLGGFQSISPIDIHSSRNFLVPLLSTSGGRVGTGRVLDCGAGIGRISKNLFLPLFDKIDIVELEAKFIEQAKNDFAGLTDGAKLDRCFCSGLQEFTPNLGEYDVIWSQWVLGHLTDTHLVNFFRRCKSGLAPNGLMVVKENVSKRLEFDSLDSSFTRPLSSLKDLIHQSGFRIIKDEKQKQFPKDLFEVRMLALQWGIQLGKL